MKENEELTASMHEELIGCDIEHDDLMVMGVFGAMRRGVPKSQALEEYDFTEEFYDKNVKRVLSQP